MSTGPSGPSARRTTFSRSVARGAPASGPGLRAAGWMDGIPGSGVAEHPAAIRRTPPTAVRTQSARRMSRGRPPQGHRFRDPLELDPADGLEPRGPPRQRDDHSFLDEDLAGPGSIGDPGSEVDRPSEYVAVAHEHGPRGDPSMHLRQPLAWRGRDDRGDGADRR